MFKKTLALAFVITAMAIASPGAADHDVDCFSGRGSTHAKFLQPSEGGVQVQTTPTGPIVVGTGLPAPSVALSTTGTFQVKIDYQCLTSLTLTATKEGATAPFYTKDWSTECNHDRKTDEVPIGLEAGNYSFELHGTACDSGIKLRRDGKGGFVADPPIL